MSRNLGYLAIISVFLVAIAAGVAGPSLARRFRQVTHPGVQTARVTLGNATVAAEVAATPEARSRGLSGRNALASDRGMLFVFDRPGPYDFWMHGMRFALDIIWVLDGRVVDVAENVPPPDGAPARLIPTSFANQVLEVNAGFAAQHGVRYGTPVTVRFDGPVEP